MSSNAAWESEDLSAQSRELFYKAAVARIDSAEQDARAMRRLGLWVGVGGVIAAVVMATASAAVYLKKPVPPPPGFVLIDHTSGYIGETMLATDAAKVLTKTEAANERAIREFITRCEGYVPETWERVGYHECMIMAAPEEQRRRAADIGRGGPNYPPAVFGKGWAMPTEFLAFTRQADGANNTLHYEVRYERIEVKDGREQRPRYTAHIYAQWHPELSMSAQDRLLNEGGFLCVSFSRTKD